MSTSATPQIPPTGTSKADPDTLTLRASPRPVTRLNRRMLAVLAGTLGVIILGATLWSLQPRQREHNATTELYNVDRISRAESPQPVAQGLFQGAGGCQACARFG